MEKQYLLLRNNHETGPHSLEELVQLGLKPFDLIWVQGRSGGWSYPSEIEALKSYLPAAKTEKEDVLREQPVREFTSPKENSKHPHIFVSMPHKNSFAAAEPTPANFSASSVTGNDLEARAEALRKRAQAFNGAPATADVRTNFNRSINSVEEDYTSWLYQTKTKKKKTVSGKQLAATILITAGLLGGWWGGKKLFSTSDGTLTQQGTPLQQSAVLSTSSENTAQDYLVNQESSATEPIILEKKDEPSIQKNKPVANDKKKAKLVVIDSPVVAANNNQTVEKQETPEDIIPENTNPAPEILKPTVEEAPKKKSGIGKIFAGIFGKKKNGLQKKKRVNEKQQEEKMRHRLT